MRNKCILFCLMFFFAIPVYAKAPERVVSIGGVLTEIVYALESEHVLVGSDTTSYYPNAAKMLPKIGYQRALSVEGILSLTPDLILLTEDAGPPSVLMQLKTLKIPVLLLKEGKSVEDIKYNIQQIANILEKRPQAAKLIAKIEHDKQELSALLLKQKKTNKRVMFILYHGGGASMVAGRNTPADSIITLSGAKNIVIDYEGYKPLTPESAIALKPDIILTAMHGLNESEDKKVLLNIPGISMTPAIKNNRIIMMDALLLLGFGPRTIKTAIELNQVFQEYED